MSKAKQQAQEVHSPEAIGAHFASVQADNGKTLLKTLAQCIQAYTVENKAEYAAMIEGYGTQAKSLYDANTAKTRKSEFKKIIDHASASETRTSLFNIIGNYDSVQSLVRDLRALEKGTAQVNEEGKVEKVKAEKADDTEGNSEVTPDDKPLALNLTSKAGMVEALEIIMHAAHASGFTKASDLILQAQAAIGRGE
jgi:hypothetical protein